MLSVSGSEAAPESEVQARQDSPIEDVLQLEAEQMSVPTEMATADTDPEEAN